MARFCGRCQRSFPTRRGLLKHNGAYHRHPKPAACEYKFKYHTKLDGMRTRILFLAIP